MSGITSPAPPTPPAGAARESVDGALDESVSPSERSLRRALLLDERQAAALRRRYRRVGVRLPRSLPLPTDLDSRRVS